MGGAIQGTAPRARLVMQSLVDKFGSLGGMAATLLAGFLVTTTGNWALPFYTGAGAILVAVLVMALGVSAQPLFLEVESLASADVLAESQPPRRVRGVRRSG